ncbi:MAG: McrC family protein [Hydrogenophaga sp.]|uniref:McrC family protein n=1 Tax=Hydrogenophaga sp. TaxID=1904254 RepID=UPI00261C0233|nr:McrC family protein [Hydrogenophaga sp.]MDM7943525.1 McrC family protein [Hydrogenophaga sp.]
MLQAMYQVCEYGYLLRDGDPNPPPPANDNLLSCPLPAAFWDSLEKLVEEEDTDTRGVVYRAAPGPGRQPRLRVKNHIGVLATAEGSLEILPKLGRNGGTSLPRLRQVVGHMLDTVPDMPFRGIGEASQGVHNDTLFEWFLLRFLQRMSKLVARGLRSSYETLEDNLPVLRGRLQLQQHLQRNAANQAKLYVRFDEFTANRPENRLIHAALDVAWRRSRNTDHKRRAGELMLSFSDIPKSSPGEQPSDFKAWRKERGASHYRDIESWCKALLRPFSPVPAQGAHRFDSFLFPAEKLFEAYVAERLRLAVQGTGITIQTQGREKSLFTQQSGPFNSSYQMRPDIVIQQDDAIVICDTKWKLYEGDQAKISQADLYQMFAYANYWKGPNSTVQLAIITPPSAGLVCASGPHIYEGGNQPFELWVLPYDLLLQNGIFLSSPTPVVLPPGLLGSVLRLHVKKHQKDSPA